jgi:hypothetical protein
VAAFEQSLGIPSVMMGFGLPDDNLHAPNEKLHLPNFYRGIEAVARYLDLLLGGERGQGPRADRGACPTDAIIPKELEAKREVFSGYRQPGRVEKRRQIGASSMA